MDAKKFPEPYLEVNLGAGNNPNTVDLVTTFAFSENPDNKGVVFRLVKYKLTEEEINRIKETGELHIAVMGYSFSPMLPFVYKPEEMGFYPAKLFLGEIVDPKNMNKSS